MEYERVSYKYRLKETYDQPLTWGLLQIYEGKFLVLAHGILTLKPGYMWDGPSGPTVDTENFIRASLVHDALYQLIREGVLPIKPYRKKADKLLLEICEKDGMSWFRRRYVYYAVRQFGGSAI